MLPVEHRCDAAADETAAPWRPRRCRNASSNPRQTRASASGRRGKCIARCGGGDRAGLRAEFSRHARRMVSLAPIARRWSWCRPAPSPWFVGGRARPRRRREPEPPGDNREAVRARAVRGDARRVRRLRQGDRLSRRARLLRLEPGRLDAEACLVLALARLRAGAIASRWCALSWLDARAYRGLAARADRPVLSAAERGRVANMPRAPARKRAISSARTTVSSAATATAPIERLTAIARRAQSST